MSKYLLNRNIVILIGVTLTGLALVWQGIKSDRQLTNLRQQVDVQWTQVAVEYQQRADVISAFLQTFSGNTHLDKPAATDLVQAHAQAEQAKLDPNKAPLDAEQLQKFDQAQAALTKALSNLLVLSLSKPDLANAPDFRKGVGQLLMAGNSLVTARTRFTESAQYYDHAAQSFPGVLYASILGFTYRPYFQPQPTDNDSVASTGSSH